MYTVAVGLILQLAVVFIVSGAGKNEPKEDAEEVATPAPPATSSQPAASAEGTRADSAGTGEAGEDIEHATEAFDKYAGEQNDAHPVLRRAQYKESMQGLAPG